jgi:cell division septation protein DedD
MDESAASENATTTDLLPDSVQFGATGYSVVEDATTALVWVTRTGSSTDSVTVGYATDDFTATAGSDYITTSGTLSFAEDVIMQPVRVPILNDSQHEKTESFVLFLYNVTGRVSLEAQRVAFVNIIDNDAVAPDRASVAGSAQMPDPVPVPGIVENTQCAATSSSGFTHRERYRERNITWTVNLLSLTDRANLDALATRAKSLNIPVEIQETEIDGTRYWRLQVTGFKSRSDAEDSSVIIKETLGIDSVWIFRQKQPGNIVSRCPPGKGEARGG